MRDTNGQYEVNVNIWLHLDSFSISFHILYGNQKLYNRKYKNLINALPQIINWPIAILTFTCKYAIENNHVVSYNHIT